VNGLHAYGGDSWASKVRWLLELYVRIRTNRGASQCPQAAAQQLHYFSFVCVKYFTSTKEFSMRFPSILGVACSVALVTSVSAQTASPNQKLVQFQAQPPPKIAQVQITPYPTALHQMNDVNKALNLNPEQINRLNKVTEQTQAKHRDSYNKLNTLNDADRFGATQQLHQQYYTDWNMGARDIFTAEQWNRYQQLNYQYGGFNSFYDPDVQKRLNLTAAQLKNVGEYAAWSNQQMQNIHKIGAIDPTQGAQTYSNYQKQYQEHFNKLLTPDQHKTWGDLTGKPYTFQPTFTPSK
jgi:hypothetical protein